MAVADAGGKLRYGWLQSTCLAASTAPLLDGECSIAMADDWSGSGESSVVARGQIVSAHFDGRRARDDSNFWSSVAASHLASIFATACPLHAWLFLTFALGVSQDGLHHRICASRQLLSCRKLPLEATEQPHRMDRIRMCVLVSLCAR